MHRTIQRWSFLCAIIFSTGATAQTDFRANCSKNANQLIDQGWIAQPMNKSPTNTGDPRKAEAVYRQALQDSPRCRGALLRLGSLLRRDGNWQQAEQYYDLVLKYYPNDELGLQNKAGVLVGLKKDYAGAIRIFTKLLEVQGPGNGSLHYEIAGTYSLMNDIDAALKALERAIAINPGWGNTDNAQRSAVFENLRKDSRFWALVKKQ